MNIAETGLDIRKRRREIEITQEALADAAGVSTPFLIGLEKGGNENPGMGKVIDVIAALEKFEAERISHENRSDQNHSTV